MLLLGLVACLVPLVESGSTCLLDTSGRRPQESVGGGLELATLRALAADVAVEVAELCGATEVPELEVRLVPRATLEARARLEVDRTFPAARRVLDEAVAKALGMLPREADLAELYWQLLADGVGGVRDSVQGELLVADDAKPNLARLVLAHELAQWFGEAADGGAGAPATTDERLARSAVREARNMLVVAAWVREHLASEDLQALALEEARRSRASEPLPPFVWKPILGLYAQGQAFLARQARLGPLGAAPKQGDVARALAAPPRTTEELLHPARYWDPTQREPETPVGFDIETLPDGWEVVHEDSLGELVLALLATPPEQRRGLSASPLGIAEVRFTSSAAEGWDGDRVVLARSADGTYVRLATRWEDEDEAGEFAGAVRVVGASLGLPWTVEHAGLFVIVTAAEGLDAAERAALDVAVSPRFT